MEVFLFFGSIPRVPSNQLRLEPGPSGIKY